MSPTVLDSNLNSLFNSKSLAALNCSHFLFLNNSRKSCKRRIIFHACLNWGHVVVASCFLHINGVSRKVTNNSKGKGVVIEVRLVLP